MNTKAEATILERETRALDEMLVPRETEAAIVVHEEQPLSQDETLKNVVTVARSNTNRDDVLSIVRKLLNMSEDKR